MAAFKLYSNFQTFWGDDGTLLSGGELRFYEAGTTTPKDVYADQALSVNNGSTVDLDASGRPDVDIWGDGEYFVELYNSAGVKQGDEDNIEVSGGAADSLPAGDDGDFLTLITGVPAWTTIEQVPDPTGHANATLTTDGTDVFWGDPDDTEPGVVTHQTVVAAATTNIDLSLGLSVKLTQDVDITTLTFSNVPDGAFVLSIRRVKDATATARAITWPSSVKWPSGTAPTLSATSGAIDEISLKYADSVYTGTYQLAFA